MFAQQLLFCLACLLFAIICCYGDEPSNDLERKVENFLQLLESSIIDPDSSDLFDSGAYLTDDFFFCESLIGVCTHSLSEFEALARNAGNDGLLLSIEKTKYLASTPLFTSLPSVLVKADELLTVGDCETLIHDRYYLFFFNENGNLISQFHVTDSNEDEALAC